MSENIRELLQAVADGRCNVEEAILHVEASRKESGEVRFDWNRASRKGLPEVVYCPGKETEHLINIMNSAAARRANVAFSRLSPDTEQVLPCPQEWSYDGRAHLGTLIYEKPAPRGTVAVITAGTTDIPVALEAAGIAEFCGCTVKRYFDVGVAGLHRIFSVLDDICASDVAIVAAGMEGALPSVVASLVPCLVIGLPTSVGYGVASGGSVALSSMLSSCCPGIVTVNIDNGVGAGMAAALACKNEKNAGSK